MLKIRPIHLKEANEWVKRYHRHNIPTAGGKFSIAVYSDENMCGCAICGRPTARKLDNGRTLEIYRCCTDGTKNACSKLYGACVKIGFAMGYERIITYSLTSENGSSLMASNFIFEGKAGGINWTGKRKRDYYISPNEMKNRWAIYKGGDNNANRNTGNCEGI